MLDAAYHARVRYYKFNTDRADEGAVLKLLKRPSPIWEILDPPLCTRWRHNTLKTTYFLIF